MTEVGQSNHTMIPNDLLVQLAADVRRGRLTKDEAERVARAIHKAMVEVDAEAAALA